MGLTDDRSGDYQIGYKKPPVASRFKPGNRANPRGRPRNAETFAAILRRALDATEVTADSERRQPTKREQMIRGLVERSVKGELAATKLLFELLRKADPRAVIAGPADADPLGEDAIIQLKRRLARLASTTEADAATLDPPPDADLGVARLDGDGDSASPEIGC